MERRFWETPNQKMTARNGRPPPPSSSRSARDLRSALPFVLHIMVETPAALRFLFTPDAQILHPQPDARSIVRQYAVLLFSTVLIALICLLNHRQRISRLVAGALSIYHIAPILRAGTKLSNSRLLSSVGKEAWREPALYVVVHFACFLSLLDRYCVGAGRLR